MKVLVVGTGAVGSLYGSLLALQGAEVSVLARSDYEAVKAAGIDIETPEGLRRFRPARVLRSAAELEEKPDYVLLCVKVAEGVDRAALLRDAVGPGTAIVLLCNGVGVEADIARAFPGHELVSGLAFVCAARTAPGKVSHLAYGHLALGNYPAGLSAKTLALCAAFRRAGVECEASPNILGARWRKCVWNAAFNPLSVLSGGLSTAAILDAQESLVRAVMEEVAAVAQADGHQLPEGVVEANIEMTRNMPPYKTSMLLDFEAGRPMETEAILGNAVRLGQSLGVAIPHLETLYALMRLRELGRGAGGA